jgi:predicted permease
METLMQDVRYALRSLISSPVFALASVLSLAIGIGANTAIFSVIDTVLINPVPFKVPDRLVMVWESNTQQDAHNFPTSPLNFLAWKGQNRSFDEMEGFRFFPFNISGDGEPERVWGLRVSGGLFDLLGTTPALGRTFLPEEDQPGKGRVVVLSHSLWERRYSSDKGILGRGISLNNNSFTVIGVMPPDFQFPIKGMMPILSQTQVDLWVPLAFDANQAQNPSRSYGVIGRLKPGLSVKQASDDISTIAESMREQYPQFNKGWTISVVPLKDQIAGKIRPTLMLLFGAVGCVLLIACVNVANLLLARAAVRQKEIGIRMSIGANRGRLLRQLFTESLVLSLTAGTLGLILSVLCVRVILAVSPDVVPLTSELGVNGTLLAFSLVVSVVTGILFGVVPALETSKVDLNIALKDGGREGSGGIRRNRIGKVLVVSEVALASVLLIGAGLLIKSFDALQQVDTGFNPKNLLTMQLDLSAPKYNDQNTRTVFFKTLLERFRSIPGVVEAGATTTLPFSTGEEENGFFIEGRQMYPGQFFVAPFRIIDPDYFTVMGVPLHDGRFFTPQDDKDTTPIVMINDTMAKRYWPGESAIGKRIALTFEPNKWRSVVGVVGDVRGADLALDAKPEMYLVYTQLSLPFSCFVVRTAANPGSMVSAVKREVLSADSNQPVSNIKMMDQMISDSVSRPRLRKFLLEIFAGISIVLAAIGLYGLMSYSVGQRSREIGIRMAVGAQRQDVLYQILREGCRLAGLGMLLGLAMAFMLGKELASLLYGVSSGDPLTFVAVSALLAGVAVVSCFFPARRAANVDPIVALRQE